MRYISTRGGLEPLGLADAVMTGLAPDGGLILPESIPHAADRLEAWSKLDYGALAAEIIGLYGDLPPAALRDMIATSYQSFRHPDITPVVERNGIHILELFHGPTLAFKDLALQFLGNLFAYILEERDTEMNIIAATSGDTGSAAIHGVRGRPRIRIFVLYPHGRISPVQERQMTSVTDANVFTFAVEGSFDDCQFIVKDLFQDLPFKARYRLGAVNSINWARVLAQIVYYFFAAFRVMAKTGADGVDFTVPTGNFGDIFAGYVAARMGLPIRRLALATNENDILRRFFSTGEYSPSAVAHTVSPSMDIQVASNFERYLYYRLGEDPVAVRERMQAFTETQSLSVAPLADGRIDDLIVADSGDTATTLETIRRYHADHDYLLDPHSAVGVYVAERCRRDDVPMISLATAHPAKFSQAISDATGRDLAHHEILDGLLDGEVSRTIVAADSAAVRAHLETRIPA